MQASFWMPDSPRITCPPYYLRFRQVLLSQAVPELNFMSQISNRIPSLDGLRALSIVLVIISHLAGTGNFPLTKQAGDLFDLGALGVRVFFIISGFLITGLLLHEINKTGSISLRRFYFRRTFRIFPAYYFFLLTLLCLTLAGTISLTKADLWPAFTYTTNYFPAGGWYVGHTWSLAVEEQFYLLWPAVLLVAGRKKGRVIALMVIILCPLIRIAYLHSSFGTKYHFEQVADSIATGCLLASVQSQLQTNSFYQSLKNSGWFGLLPLVILGISALHNSAHLFLLVGIPLMNLGIALCIDWCVTNSTGRIGRFLNSSPLVFIGTLSYSLYLWQQLFLNRRSDALIHQFPLNLILALIVAMASFYLIEQPALRLRQRLEPLLFSPRKSAARAASTEPARTA